MVCRPGRWELNLRPVFFEDRWILADTVYSVTRGRLQSSQALAPEHRHVDSRMCATVGAMSTFAVEAC